MIKITLEAAEEAGEILWRNFGTVKEREAKLLSP